MTQEEIKYHNQLWYYKTYNQLIDKCIQLESDGYPEDMYTEVHHILPKCMGGTNKEDNLVRMPVRYHIMAHLLLVKIYPNIGKIIYEQSLLEDQEYMLKQIEKIIEKEISETDLDHIKSGPNELVIGNFWIFKGKITILKSSLFPIDPFIIMYTAILMEIIFWIKAKISRFRENKSSKSVVITGGDEIGS